MRLFDNCRSDCLNGLHHWKLVKRVSGGIVPLFTRECRHCGIANLLSR